MTMKSRTYVLLIYDIRLFISDSECYGLAGSDVRMSCFVNKALVNVGGELAKLVLSRVSTEVNACLAYDTHNIVRKVCLDAELNGQNYVNLDIENANAYPPCLVDMDIEKGNSEAPKTNDEDVEKLKIEGPLTLILPSTKRGDCGSTLEVESTFTVYFAQPEPFVDGHNLTYNCYTYVE